MFEKGMEYSALRMDSRESVAHALNHSSQVIDGSIGELLSLDVAPQALYWVQIRRIGREANRRQPTNLVLHVLAHGATAM